MLDSLIGLIKENSENLADIHPVLGEKERDKIFETTAGIILDNLKARFFLRGPATIHAMFYNGATEDSLPEKLIPEVTSALVEKNNLPKAQASDIASKLIPSVVTKLLRKTNDPKDGSFSLDKIITELSKEQ